MNTANRKDIKWFRSLQLDENRQAKLVWAGVGPAGEFWVSPRDVPFIEDDVWLRAEEHPRPVFLIDINNLFINLVEAAELTTAEHVREEIKAFVVMMRGVLRPERFARNAHGQWDEEPGFSYHWPQLSAEFDSDRSEAE